MARVALHRCRPSAITNCSAAAGGLTGQGIGIMTSGRIGGAQRLLLCALVAAALPAAAAREAPRYDFQVGTDYRRAQLDWNIAGDLSGSNPNVLSELRWYELDIAQLSAALRAQAGRVVVELAGDYGDIADGKNRDSDYLADNRQLESFRSANHAAGRVYDARLGVGYRFPLFDAAARHYGDLIPMLGWSLQRQNLRIRDGLWVVPAGGGPISGLDSRYEARWRGPWIGATLRLEAAARAVFSIDLAYHWADYAAKADWNLRSDLAHPLSFRHDSVGSGMVAGLALSYRCSRHWSIVGRVQAESWRARPGVDTFYLVDAGTGAVQAQATRLNAVRWRSHSLGLSALYRF